jgi:hypothetical protein
LRVGGEKTNVIISFCLRTKRSCHVYTKKKKAWIAYTEKLQQVYKFLTINISIPQELLEISLSDRNDRPTKDEYKSPK